MSVLVAALCLAVAAFAWLAWAPRPTWRPSRAMTRIAQAAALVAAVGMSVPASANAPGVGDFRVSNYAVGFQNNNYLWRGYAFTVSRETVVTHLYGGGGPNCEAGFQGGLYEASWTGGATGEGSPRLDTLLRGVSWNPTRDPGDPPQEELVAFSSPVTLQPGQTYFIAQGRVSSGSGCHYAANSIDVQNLLIGSPIIDQWWPNADAAYQPSGSGTAEDAVGRIASSTTPIRVLMGFRYETPVEPPVLSPEAGTGDALSIAETAAMVEGLLASSGADSDTDATTLYFEYGTDPSLTGSGSALLPANPHTVVGPATNVPFSVQLNGLSHGVTYYYRAVAINEAARHNGQIRSFVHDGEDFAITVTAGSNPGGTVTPTQRAVLPGETTTFTAIPEAGMVASPTVGGTCPTSGASWTDGAYTTGPIFEACTVAFTFGPAAQPVGGTLSGLAPGAEVTLQNNGGDDVVLAANGAFTFTTPMPSGSTYAVTVSSHPSAPAQSCSVTGATGTVADSPVTAIAVTCVTDTYPVSISAGLGGDLSPSSAMVTWGESASFTLTPAASHDIDEVTGCGGTLAGDTYTTAPITGPCTVEASFALRQYSVVYVAGDHGVIHGEASQLVHHGQPSAMVTAEADEGYHFVAWSDGLILPSRSEASVSGDLVLTAHFAINQYSVVYAVDGHGAIEGQAHQTITHGGDGSTVFAVPAEGHHFVAWSDGEIRADRTDSGVTSNLTFTASFAVNHYAVTYLAAANGAIEGVTPQTVAYGDETSAVVAVPHEGYHFVTWSDGLTEATRADLDVTGQLTFVAYFAINEYSVSYLAGDNGDVEGDIAQVVTHGDDATTVTAVPRRGYHFVAWSDGFASATRTDAGVTGDVTLTAHFAINHYAVTYAAGPHGAIEGEASQVVAHGSDATAVTAVPAEGYHFVAWSDGVTEATRADVAVSGELTLSASFAINHYSLTYAAGDHGSLTGNTAQVVEHGDHGRAVTAVPHEGYHFVAWSDGVTTAARTDTAVTGDIDVTATFALNALRFVAGDGQVGPAGSTLAEPLTVAVEDQQGGPIAGATVTWTAPKGGAVSPATSITDAHGLAQTVVTLPTEAGVHAFVASARAGDGTPLDGSPIALNATAQPDAAAQLVVTAPEDAEVGEQVALAVEVYDFHGNRIDEPVLICVAAQDAAGHALPLIPVAFADPEDAPDGVICGRIGASGQATLTTGTTVAGKVVVEASVVGASVHEAAFVDFYPGPPHGLRIDTIDATALACQPAELEARVVDVFGNATRPSPDNAVEVTIRTMSVAGPPTIVTAALDDLQWTQPGSVTGRVGHHGRVALTIALAAAADAYVTWSSEELDGDGRDSNPAKTTFLVGPTDATASEVTASGSQLFAYGGLIELSAVPRDACGLAVGPGAEVSFEASYGALTDTEDLGDGVYATRFSTGAGECPAEPAEIRVRVDGALLDDLILVDVACGEVAATSPVYLAFGRDTAKACAQMGVYTQVAVVPVDPAGGALPPGQDVTVVEDPPFVVGGSVWSTTDPETGVTTYTVEVGSNRCGAAPYPVELRVGGVPLAASPELHFTCPGIEDGGVALSAFPAVARADGESAAVVRVAATDSCGNPAFGRQVGLAILGGLPASLSATSITTANARGSALDGVAMVEVRSDVAGTMGVAAHIGGRTFVSASDLLTFVPLPAPPHLGFPVAGEPVDDGQPTFSGTGEPGSIIEILIDGDVVAEVVVDADGEWSWTPEVPLADGQHTVTVRTKGAESELSHTVVIDVAAVGPGDFFQASGSGCSAATPGGGGAAALALLLLLLVARRRILLPTR